MKNSSLYIVCGPPWISTNSGYFFAGSKPGGSAIMLWMRAPRFALNQNSLHRPPVDQGDALGVEGGERAARAARSRRCARLPAGSPRCPSSRRSPARPPRPDLQPESVPDSSRPISANLPARRGHGEQALAAVVLGEQVDGLAVRAQPVAADGAVEAGCHGPRRRIRPVEAHQAVVVVGQPGVRRRAGVERGAVRRQSVAANNSPRRR